MIKSGGEERCRRSFAPDLLLAILARKIEKLAVDVGHGLFAGAIGVRRRFSELENGLEVVGGNI